MTGKNLLSTSKKNFLVKSITPVFFLILFFFIFTYIDKINVEELKSIDFNIKFLLISLFFGLFYRFWAAVTWISLLKNIGATNLPSFVCLNNVFAKSWLGRYIPGKVTWIAGKIYFASQYGIDKTKLTVTSFLEALLQIGIIVILSLPLVFFGHDITNISSSMVYGCTLLTIGTAVLLVPSVFNYFAGSIYQFFKKEAFDKESNGLSMSMIFSAVPYYIVGFLASGTCYYFLCISMVSDLEYIFYPYILGVFNFAGVIGIISLFSPSGLGVREGVQFFFLVSIISPGTVLAIVIAARIWSLLLDVLYFFISMSFEKIKTHKLSRS